MRSLSVIISVLAVVCIASAGCPAILRSCGDACYLPAMYCCVDGQLTQKWACPHSTGEEPPVPSTVTPTPTSWKSDGTPDLTIKNNCKFNLFVEARMGGGGEPLPGQSKTVTKLSAGQSISYNVPDEGASGTRFWAKYGCDDNGLGCLIGDSQQYYPNPPGGCPPGGCHVPIDSLFEATWGCKPGSSCNDQNPTTWWDTSQVDGWTLPYKVHVLGQSEKCDCDGNGNCPNLKIIDGSKLDLKKCPSNDDASWDGKFAKFGNFSMSSLDLRYIRDGQVLGCMSPCKKLNFGAPEGYGISEGTVPTLFMCCPTPNPDNCRIEEGCIGSEDCRRGPIENTKFVKAVHAMAEGVYAYSYDDAKGLHACPAGTVQYQMEFCPDGSVDYPIQA